ncbi:MAG: flagellar hook-basal body complex protein FliE [Pseudomonadota bacterium]|nr:flagellar hook-basal body complex protein FliE [Pseudomonadota bacterium]
MIHTIGSVGGIGAVAPLGETARKGAGGFADALSEAVRAVEGAQTNADDKLRGVATGQSVDIHGTMIALEEANISLRMMGSVRDKAVEGWQAIWNMPI